MTGNAISLQTPQVSPNFNLAKPDSPHPAPHEFLIVIESLSNPTAKTS
jgi:hypothetical protein